MAASNMNGWIYLLICMALAITSTYAADIRTTHGNTHSRALVRESTLAPVINTATATNPPIPTAPEPASMSMRTHRMMSTASKVPPKPSYPTPLTVPVHSTFPTPGSASIRPTLPSVPTAPTPATASARVPVFSTVPTPGSASIRPTMASVPTAPPPATASARPYTPDLTMIFWLLGAILATVVGILVVLIYKGIQVVQPKVAKGYEPLKTFHI